MTRFVLKSKNDWSFVQNEKGSELYPVSLLFERVFVLLLKNDLTWIKRKVELKTYLSFSFLSIFTPGEDNTDQDTCKNTDDTDDQLKCQ